MSYEGEVLADSPSAYWRFAESVSPWVDAIGGFTLEDATAVGAAGLIGNAVDVTDTYLTAPLFLPDFIAGNLSFEFWIQPDDIATRGPFFGVGPGDSYFMFYIDADGSASAGLTTSGGSDSRFVPGADTPAGLFVDGAWRHVVYTKAADGTAKLYVNKVLIATANHSSAGFSTTTLYVGLGTGAAKGLIDELAVYEHVLSFDRVEAHYDAQVGGSLTYSELVMGDLPEAYWRLGEHAGDVAVDYTGNGHHGIYTSLQRKGYPGAIFDDFDTAVTFGDIEVAHHNDDDFIDLPNDSLPNAAPLTIEGWFSLDTVPFAPEDQRLWSITDAGTPDEISLIVTNPNSGNLILRCKIGMTVTEFTVPFSSGAFLWRHIVAYIAGVGATSRLYLDGVQVASGVGFDISPYASWFYLGWVFPYDYDRPGKFLGAQDEVALYHHELIALDVWKHYTMGRSGAGEAAMEGTAAITLSASPALLTVPVVLAGVNSIVFGGALPALNNDPSIHQRLFPLRSQMNFEASMPLLSVEASLEGTASLTFNQSASNLELGVAVRVDAEYTSIVFGGSSPALIAESSLSGTADISFVASTSALTIISGMNGTAALMLSGVPATLAVIKKFESDNTEATIKFNPRAALNALMLEYFASPLMTFGATAEMRATIAFASDPALTSFTFDSPLPVLNYGSASLSGEAALALSPQAANLSSIVSLSGTCPLTFASSTPSIDGIVTGTGGAFHRSKIRRPR